MSEREGTRVPRRTGGLFKSTVVEQAKCRQARVEHWRGSVYGMSTGQLREGCTTNHSNRAIVGAIRHRQRGRPGNVVRGGCVAHSMHERIRSTARDRGPLRIHMSRYEQEAVVAPGYISRHRLAMGIPRRKKGGQVIAYCLLRRMRYRMARRVNPKARGTRTIWKE